MADEVPQALRRTVAERAEGRCEYCLVHEDDRGAGHEVDHIVGRQHGGRSQADNLAWACQRCDRRKGANLVSVGPHGDYVRLFHPRWDCWRDHFRLVGARVEAATAVGWVTVRLLDLNDELSVRQRELLQQVDRYPRS